MIYLDKSKELEEDVFDVLYELGNMGVATAVKPIGNMRGLEIHVDAPNVLSINSKLYSFLGYKPEDIVIGVTTKVSNAFDGVILFLLSKEFVKNTVHIMTEIEFEYEDLLVNMESVSAIQEMVNYMTAGYTMVIGNYLNKAVYISEATIGMTQIQKIINKIFQEKKTKVDKIACVNTRFVTINERKEETEEDGQVLIFPNEDCIAEFIKIMNE